MAIEPPKHLHVTWWNHLTTQDVGEECVEKGKKDKMKTLLFVLVLYFDSI